MLNHKIINNVILNDIMYNSEFTIIMLQDRVKSVLTNFGPRNESA